ncbi:MAG: response regulator [Gammaproteobacteria bacterium]|nr:response regulator [Gammaproteobacteria bacterium]
MLMQAKIYSMQAPLLLSQILVVDDEPSNVKLLQKILKSEGYANVVATHDPRQVLGLCQATQFDLILLDINMPYLDGFQVMEQLRELDKVNSPPILVLTAQRDTEYRLRALRNGARDFVTKPFDQLELIARVQNLLEVQFYHKTMRNQNQLLERMVDERTRALQETRLQVVRRLGRAAEYRDNETGLHIIRMSKISALLGRASGMSETESELLLHASPMHDIGKIGIPDEVLLKPGRFVPEEWEIMKTHTTIGADILSGGGSSLLDMASEIALTHHEKWDGSGYPGGLERENIPLVGRIVALADVYDALTSERPYKKAWSAADAVNYIKTNRGVHFDPRLVEIFLDQLPGIQEISQEYAEPAAPAS